MLLLDLLDINETDAENCTACVAAHQLWPIWPHGGCPFHHGLNRGFYLAGAPLASDAA